MSAQLEAENQALRAWQEEVALLLEERERRVEQEERFKWAANTRADEAERLLSLAREAGDLLAKCWKAYIAADDELPAEQAMDEAIIRWRETHPVEEER